MPPTRQGEELRANRIDDSIVSQGAIFSIIALDGGVWAVWPVARDFNDTAVSLEDIQPPVFRVLATDLPAFYDLLK
jgi:hypothetical protein